MTSGYWFIIENDFIWLAEEAEPGIAYLPELSLPFTLLSSPYLVCQVNEKACYVIDKALVPIEQLEILKSTPFRQAHDLLTPEFFKLATRAKALLHWLAVHQFCGRCGHPTTILSEELARQCLSCGELFYPKTSPSVIVVIERENQILLARSPHFSPGIYSCISGFIEPGETAEDTLEREVFEEVSLKIKNIRYFASQHWPFPNSFMMGFFADYASGDIQIDNIEIIDAKWFSIDHLPKLPTHASMARKLIEDWIQRHSE